VALYVLIFLGLSLIAFAFWSMISQSRKRQAQTNSQTSFLNYSPNLVEYDPILASGLSKHMSKIVDSSEKYLAVISSGFEKFSTSEFDGILDWLLLFTDKKCYLVKRSSMSRGGWKNDKANERTWEHTYKHYEFALDEIASVELANSAWNIRNNLSNKDARFITLVINLADGSKYERHFYLGTAEERINIRLRALNVGLRNLEAAKINLIEGVGYNVSTNNQLKISFGFWRELN
jgi:hypothetical protein